MDNNPILEDLNWRRTVKKYDSRRKIPTTDLAILYEAMRLSASSINSQPWRFIVIESDAAKQRLHDTFTEQSKFNQAHVFDSSQVILFCHNPTYSREDYAEVVDKGIKDGRINKENREAAFAGFVFAEFNTDENGDTSNWTKAQLYLALGNTLHILARLKIGSTPLEGINRDAIEVEFKKELAGYQCHVALAMGYSHSEEDNNAKLPKSRRSLKSVLLKL